MKPHATDSISLGAGLAFLWITGFWLLARLADLDVSALALLPAGLLVIIGAVGMAHVVRAARRRE
jgi:hypothetical protein